MSATKPSALEALKARQLERRAQPDAQSSLAQVAPLPEAQAAVTIPPPKKTKGLSWTCGVCQQECVHIRTENRCLCGHRFKEHEQKGSDGCYSCKNAKCTCKSFFYIVAEGSWVLTCRCKHKAVDHDPVTHACRKPACKCGGFDSPWVCNCDHPWAAHQQIVVEREVKSLEQLMAEAALMVPGVERIQRGMS